MVPVVIQPAVVVLGLLLLGALDPLRYQTGRTARAPREQERALSVTTYNVNYALSRDASTLQAISQVPAELVFLQETNESWQRQAQSQSQLRALYPHQSWLHARGPRAGGQAVLARSPFVVRHVIPSPTGWFPAVLVVAETPLGKVQVLALHLHPQITEQGSWVLGHFATDAVRLKEILHYLNFLEQALPTLIVGDFNEGTDGAALRLLEARGFRSALPEFAPDAQTWHWPLGIFTLGGQLDHLLYDPWFEPLSATVERTGGSDHLPVRALFTRAEAVRRTPPPRGASMTLSLGAAR